MNFPTLRDMIAAVVKPGIKALQRLYDHQVRVMFERLTRQESYVRESQAQIAALSDQVHQLMDQVIQLNAATHLLKTNLFTAQQVAVLDSRVQDLEVISEIIYKRMIELMITGRIIDPTIPTFDNAQKEHVYSQEELVQFWKTQNGIKDGDALTEAQIITLNAFLAAYREAHPDSV